MGNRSDILETDFPVLKGREPGTDFPLLKKKEPSGTGTESISPSKSSLSSGDVNNILGYIKDNQTPEEKVEKQRQLKDAGSKSHPITVEPTKEQRLDQEQANVISKQQKEEERKYAKRQSIDETLKATNGDLTSTIFTLNGVKNPNQLSDTKKAEIIDKTLNDPDFQDRINKDDRLSHEAAVMKNTLPELSMDYTLKKVEQKIGQNIQDNGKNATFFQTANEEDMDKMVEDMVANGKMSQQERTAYMKNKSVVGDWVKHESPDIVHSLHRGLISGASEVESTFRDIGNKVTGGLLQKAGLIETNEDRQKRQDQEQDVTPYIEPKSLAAKVVKGMSEFTGYAAPMIINAALTKGAGFGTEAAETVPALLQFEGKNAENSRRYFEGDQAKQLSYTALGTLIDVTLGKMLPANKAAASILKKEALSSVGQMTGDIATDAAIKKNFLNKFTNTIGEVAKHNAKTGAIVTAFEGAHDVVDAVFGQRDMPGEEDAKKYINTFLNSFVSATPLSLGITAMSKAGVSPKLQGERVVNIAENPEQHIQEIRDEAAKNDEPIADTEKKVMAIKDASKAWGVIKELPKLTIPQKEKFFVKDLQQKELDAQAADAPVDVIKSELQDKANEAYTDKIKIYNGTDTAPEHETYQPELKTPEQIEPELKNQLGEEKTKQATKEINDISEYDLWPEELPKMEKEMAKQFPLQFLKEVAEQARTKDIAQATEKNATETEHTAREGAVNYYGEHAVKLAEEIFPNNKTEENAIQEQSAGSVLQYPSGSIGETGGISGSLESGQQGKEITGTHPEEKETGGEKVAAGEGDENNFGISHESLNKVAERIGLKKPERGTFLSPEEQIKRGRALLQGGVDPEKVASDFEKDGKASADEISVARANFENLTKEAQAAKDKYGKNSSEFAKAKLEMQKWQDNVLKPMGTSSGASFAALQGETDLDTGSFVSVSHALTKETGKEPNRAQEKKIEELTARNKDLKKQTEVLEAKLIDATDKELSKTSKEKKSKKTHDEYVKERKDSFQAARDALKQLRSGESGLGVSLPLVRELAAVSPHISKIVKSLIEEGVDKLGDIVDAIHDELSKDMPGLRRRDVLDLVSGDYNKQEDKTIAPNKYADIKRQSTLVKKLEDLQNGLPESFDADKPEQTPEVKKLLEQIKKVKKDLADIGYMKDAKKDFQKEPLTAEEKSINKLQKELDALQEGNAKQKNPGREPSEKEKELREKIKDQKEKMGLTPSKQEKPLSDAEQKEADEKELEGLQAKFIDKKDNKFTIGEAKYIWDYAKKNYLDKGISYRDMITSVSSDLGLTWRQINEAITSPKTKSISDEMWKKRADFLRSQTATKGWIESQDANPALKLLQKVSGAFRGAAVFGHGGIFVGTHAGMTLFQPTTWKYTIPAFFRGWKFAYGKQGTYERRIEQLKNDPNYVLAQRAGLKNNPEKINTEEFQDSQKFLGKLGLAGEKGFNAIKVLRQDLFNHEYNKLSSDAKSDPQSAISVARLINSATGATNLKIPKWFNEATFAGGMEAARWGKLTRNPVEATGTALKALFAPSKATVHEKVFAKVWAKRVGEQLATFTGAILANAAIQNTLNPKNPVNYTNPNNSDFLKFKFGDITIDPTSGMRGVGMFIYGLGKIPFESQKQLRGDTRMEVLGKNVAGYGRGKLAPLYSTMADFYTKQDYNKNPLPFSEDKPTPGHHKLTWGEYAWSKAPLPIAEAAHVTYQSAVDNGADKVQLNHVLNGIVSGAISGSTGFRVGEYNAEAKKHSPFTEEDNKIPSFKYFLDKGLELPNTALSSEKVKDKSSHTEKRISDYPKDIQDKYQETHKNYLEKSLSDILKKGYVYVNPYGDVATSRNEEGKRKDINDLTKEETAKVLHIAQSEATTKAKHKIFNIK